MRRACNALALCLLVLISVESNAQEERQVPSFLVFPVKTQFQRKRVEENLTAVLYIDTSQILSPQGVDLENFPFQEIRTRLREFAKADSKLQISIYYPKVDLDRFQHDLFRYLIIGFCHDMGFGTVKASGMRREIGKPWSEFVRSIQTEKPDTDGDDEPEIVKGSLRGHVITTNYSRLLTSGADCAVFYRFSNGNKQEELESKVKGSELEKSFGELIAEMNLPQKGKICFHFHDQAQRDEHALMEHFSKLAKDLGFQQSSFVFD